MFPLFHPFLQSQSHYTLFESVITVMWLESDSTTQTLKYSVQERGRFLSILISKQPKSGNMSSTRITSQIIAESGSFI